MKPNPLKHISTNLLHLMESAPTDVSAKKLASCARISYSTLAPILRGDRDFGVTKLIALAEALNVSPNDLLKGTYNEPTHSTMPSLALGKRPRYLASFVTSAELTRCNFYDLDAEINHTVLFSFSLACTANPSSTIDLINSAIIEICGPDTPLDSIYVYASVLDYEHLTGRAKLKDLGTREYGAFIMEPDWKLSHLAVFSKQNGIVLTINDGYTLSYSMDKGKTIHKVQGYTLIASEAGNMWLGCEAVKHAINVQEGIEKKTLLSDKVLSLVHSDLNLISTRVFDNPKEIYSEVSSIVKELAVHEEKSSSLIEQGFKNMWKRIQLIDKETQGEPLSIYLAGDLAYLYEEFIPKGRLVMADKIDEAAYFDYTQDLLKGVLPQ